MLYVGMSVVIYVVLDRYSFRSVPADSVLLPLVGDVWLLLQVPLSVLLCLLLLVSVAPTSLGADLLSNIGPELKGFHGYGEIVAASAVVGFHLSTNFVVAHELMHRPGKFWKSCSRLLLMMFGDAQFQEAHIFGHHANVGTPRDPATARRGEPLYGFVIRSTIGQWKEAYAYEGNRLRRRRWLERLAENRVLRGNIGSLLLFVGVEIFFGLVGLLSYVIVAGTAKLLLEAINYIQHYGLVRHKGVRNNASYSWESDGLGSSLILFNLTRHSQHHQKPLLSCGRLEHCSHSPQLRGGYMLTLLICFVPKLWFRTVHPAIDQLEQVRGSPQ